jgi:hypothetical protein
VWFVSFLVVFTGKVVQITRIIAKSRSCFCRFFSKHFLKVNDLTNPIVNDARWRLGRSHIHPINPIIINIGDFRVSLGKCKPNASVLL